MFNHYSPLALFLLQWILARTNRFHSLCQGQSKVAQGAEMTGAECYLTYLHCSERTPNTNLGKRVVKKLTGSGALHGVMAKNHVQKLFPLWTQAVWNHGLVPHAHLEHDLVVVLQFMPRALKPSELLVQNVQYRMW